VELPSANPEEQGRTEERRRLEAQYVREVEVAQEALRRHPRVAEYWAHRGFSEDLRRRFQLGASEDGTEATIPFWNRGRVHGLIRRGLEEGSNPKYLLPSKDDLLLGYRPLFIPGAAHGEAFLVEGFVDALALVSLGYAAIAVGGTRISDRQMRELRRLRGPFYILPDADESGIKATRDWAEQLYPNAFVCPPNYEKEDNPRD
jgi:DNA primase